MFAQAWHLCDPDAEKVFNALRKAGVKLGVVSNFDTRLRPLLRALNCDHWFDAVAVSAEVCALVNHFIIVIFHVYTCRWGRREGERCMYMSVFACPSTVNKYIFEIREIFSYRYRYCPGNLPL